METIICPNCGAENSHYGRCEYCGTEINRTIDTTKEYTSHGKHKVSFDERVLSQKYDKFEDETETFFKYGEDGGWIRFGVYTKYRGDDLHTDERVLFGYRHKKDGSEYFFISGLYDGIVHADGMNFKIDYRVSEEMLAAICSARKVEVKFRRAYEDAYFDEESIWVFVKLAQVFYNTFIDKSVYTGSADKLYQFYEKKITAKTNQQKQEHEQIQRSIKNEKRLSCIIPLIILIVLIVGGILKFIYKW